MTSPSPSTETEYRPLAVAEIERLDEIDRSEVIDGRYQIRDGVLVLDTDHHFEAHGWPPGEPDVITRRVHECLSRGGTAWGAFAGDRLVGIAVLDGRRIGSNLDTLDMYLLHTSNGYRGRGIGEALVGLVRQRATELGASSLYVSSTPSTNSVNFYQRRGFGLASHVDPEPFALEPDDIHMEMPL